MREAFTDGIVSAAESATGFSGTNVFFGRPNLKTTYPYVIIDGIESEYDLDAINVYEPARIQFSVVGVTQAQVQIAGEALFAIFDLGQANITITGWTVLLSKRFTPSQPVQQFGKIWRWVFEYRIQIYQTR